MTSLTNSIYEASLRAALELQLEWGVESVTESFPWNSAEDSLVAKKVTKVQTSKTNVSQAILGSEALGRSMERKEPEIKEVTDVPSLISFIEQFKDIPLARTATHDLLPEWHQEARFTIIGEIPDADEDRSGKVFSGEAGFYLEKILQSLRLKREDINFIPSIPWRPPGGRPLLPHELESAAHILQKALSLTKGLPVVTMGTTPLRLMKGKATHITKARGAWHDFAITGQNDKIRFLPTYHPLQLKAGAVVRRGLWQDMILLLNTVNT